MIGAALVVLDASLASESVSIANLFLGYGTQQRDTSLCTALVTFLVPAPQVATSSSVQSSSLHREHKPQRMARQAAMYVTHGGGPMPIIGGMNQERIGEFLRGAAKLLPQKPKAIVCVTAHWETGVPTVSTNPAPPMLFDYGGFPDAAYKLQYPAPGDPQLAAQVMQLLTNAGLPAAADSKRGYDHGTFVPLYLMFPEADVPVVQVSLMASMDPALHVKMGQALAPLRDDNVLILGSGSSFHNMRAFMQSFSGRTPPEFVAGAKAFDNFLESACCEKTPEERIDLLNRWDQAPGGKLSHPREEHLIPLHVVVGAAGQDKGKLAFRDASGGGLVTSSFVFTS